MLPALYRHMKPLNPHFVTIEQPLPAAAVALAYAALPFQAAIAQPITEITCILARGEPLSSAGDVVSDDNAAARRFSRRLADQQRAAGALPGTETGAAQVFLDAERQLPQR